jgi:hypothetical protein
VSAELTVALSADAARALTEEVKADAAALWAKLLRLYEDGAHSALGYPSWAAYCAAEFDMGRSHAYRLLDAGRVVDALQGQSPNGDSPPASEAVARELVPLRDDLEALRRVWAEALERAGGQPTAADVRSVALRALTSSQDVEWFTPAPYVEAAREVLGGIDLDPASCALANRTVKAARFYTAADDGLAQPWSGRVWLNPPYRGLARDFIDRLTREYEAGRIDAAVVLANAYRTDAAWFRPLWGYTLCFTYGRVDFQRPNGDGPSHPPHGSVFVYLGPSPERFAERFAEFGAVVRRWLGG